MADNLTLQTTVATAPSGSVIATDDVTSVHFQKIKIDVGADGVSAPLSNSNPIPISDASGSLTVDGTVATTNAGTFAVQESGGALTALQVIDDWDETDRAKVNPIVAQAGVQAGSGVVTANTQRVVLATDVALPAGTNAIGKLSANTGVDIGDVDVTSIAAGDTTIGRVKITDGTTVVDVFDYTNSNPIAVRLTDTSGDYVPAGGGIQYTEDAVAAANPVGTAIILIREDARAGSLTSLDGDNVAARGNNKGEQYVKHTDSIPYPGSTTASTAAQASIGTTAGVGLAANANRIEVTFQNTSVNVLKLCLHASTNPTQTAYHVALNACGVADDGTGGVWTSNTWRGAIQVVGSAAATTYVVTELT